jgi:hypothetical protein
VVDEAFNACVADLQRGTDWRRRYVALQWLEVCCSHRFNISLIFVSIIFVVVLCTVTE